MKLQSLVSSMQELVGAIEHAGVPRRLGADPVWKGLGASDFPVSPVIEGIQEEYMEHTVDAPVPRPDAGDDACSLLPRAFRRRPARNSDLR